MMKRIADLSEEQKSRLLENIYKRTRDQIVKDIITSDKATKNSDLSMPYKRSAFTLGDYVTLDWQHRNEIRRLTRAIKKYAEDRTRRRPLNILMHAEPGSGKSHFVKCLAKSLETYHASSVDFNMANLQSMDDLLQPLDAVRNLKVTDRLPILFLDEFDSNDDRYSMLLPLMWDGELHIGHRDLKLGKLVIILAGSGVKIEQAMNAVRGMRETDIQSETKLVDLLSRVNGGTFKIPPLDLIEGGRDRRVDKVCLTISLIHNRFNRSIEFVPWALLKFVAVTRFRYGVRSIAHLVDLLSPIRDDERIINIQHLNFPFESAEALKNSSLAYHVLADGGAAVVLENWKKCIASKELVGVLPEVKDELT